MHVKRTHDSGSFSGGSSRDLVTVGKQRCPGEDLSVNVALLAMDLAVDGKGVKSERV